MWLRAELKFSTMAVKGWYPMSFLTSEVLGLELVLSFELIEQVKVKGPLGMGGTKEEE